MFVKLKDIYDTVTFVRFDKIIYIKLEEYKHTIVLLGDDSCWEVPISPNYHGNLEDIVNNMIMLQASPLFDLTLYQKE